MKIQIVNVSVAQSAKVLAVLYMVISLPVLAIVAAIGAFSAGIGAAIVTLVIAPLIYGVITFLCTGLIAWLYNVVAQRMGAGIQHQGNVGYRRQSLKTCLRQHRDAIAASLFCPEENHGWNCRQDFQFPDNSTPASVDPRTAKANPPVAKLPFTCAVQSWLSPFSP